MAAAAEGWRDSAGCRLCGKPARTEGEKQRLPSSIVECTLSMDKPDSDWLHRACHSKVTKSASVARREPVPPAPRRSSRGRAPDPVPDPVRAAQGGWQGDQQMLASSLGSFWDEQPEPRPPEQGADGVHPPQGADRAPRRDRARRGRAQKLCGQRARSWSAWSVTGNTM